MKKYFSFFKIRVANGLQYRTAAYAGVATQFAWGFMTLLMFRAFYRADPAGFPMSFSALSSYVWLQQAFLSLFAVWFTDQEIFQAITSGNIAYELCRPADIYTMWFAKNMALRISRALLRCLPILAVAIFLPEPFRLLPPVSPIAGICFFLSMALGFLVLIAFMMLVYISAFYTLNALGMRLLAATVSEFLSGAIIPIPFFPAWLQGAVNLLPFASMQNTPFLIYNGFAAGGAILQTILLQALWLAGLVLLGRALMGRALKRVVVQGG